MHRTLFALIGLLALTAVGSVASAADIIYVPARTIIYQPAAVAYDADDRYTSAYDVQGVVTYFNQFNMTLRVNGRQFPVVLHQGTIIKPTGTTLAPSMLVNIAGYWSNGVFYANRIAVVRF